MGKVVVRRLILLGQQVFEERVKFLIQALHETLAEKGVVLIKEHQFGNSLAVIITYGYLARLTYGHDMNECLSPLTVLVDAGILSMHQQ